MNAKFKISFCLYSDIYSESTLLNTLLKLYPHYSNGVFNFPKQYLPQLVHLICCWPVVVYIRPLPLPEFKLQEKRGFIWVVTCKAMKQDFPFSSQTHVKAKAKTFARNEIEYRYCFPLNYDRYIAITNSLRGYLYGYEIYHMRKVHSKHSVYILKSIQWALM